MTHKIYDLSIDSLRPVSDADIEKWIAMEQNIGLYRKAEQKLSDAFTTACRGDTIALRKFAGERWAEFQPGDIVTLLLGGPEMVIGGITNENATLHYLADESGPVTMTSAPLATLRKVSTKPTE